MSTKTLVLVTGGNQGLGYYAIQQLAATDNYHILMGSRDLSKATAAIQTLASHAVNVEPIQIDMTSDESIHAAAKRVEQTYGHLDILMLNAGVANVSETTTRDTFKQIYDTNVFGAAVTCDAFLPLLRLSKAQDGKRIAFTSSGLGSLKWAAEAEDIYSGANFHIYRSSKAAMNMVMVHYARLLEGEGFVVSASDPGACSTGLNDYRPGKDPRDGAKVLIRAAVGKKAEVHGRVVDEETQLPW